MHDRSAGSRQVITDLVELLNGTEELRRLVRGWHRTVLFDVDGERILLDTGGDRVTVAAPDIGSAPDIGFTMDSATLLRIVREETTPLAAKMSGRITSQGSLLEILRFVSVLSATIKAYRRQEVTGGAGDPR